MSISFIAIHSYILKFVAPWGQNTSRGAHYPTLPYAQLDNITFFRQNLETWCITPCLNLKKNWLLSCVVLY